MDTALCILGAMPYAWGTFPTLSSRTDPWAADISKCQVEILRTDTQHMRSVYERAYRSLREDQPDAKEEAVMLLEAWRNLERRAAAAAGIPGKQLVLSSCCQGLEGAS